MGPIAVQTNSVVQICSSRRSEMAFFTGKMIRGRDRNRLLFCTQTTEPAKRGSQRVIVSCSSAAGDSNSSVMQSTRILQLGNAGIMACLRTTSTQLALDAARAALDGGLTVVEITMTTPSAAKVVCKAILLFLQGRRTAVLGNLRLPENSISFPVDFMTFDTSVQVIKALVREYPTASIGAGTVLTMQEAEMARQAGAKFLTSPATVEELVVAHRDGPVLYIPGAMTPTEVVKAYNLGARAVKLFPIALVGDVRFVLALSRTLAHIPLIASNGISLEMVESYLRAGALAVILSDAIFEKSAMENRKFDRIKSLASSAASMPLKRCKADVTSQHSLSL